MWTLLDTGIIIVYLAIMVWMGFYIGRKTKLASDFMVAGRGMTWWIAGISSFASYQSVWAFTGAIGFSYAVGVPVLYYYLGNAGAGLVQAYMAPRIRATRGLSLLNFFEKRFHGALRPLFALLQGVMITSDAGNRLFATALIPSIFLGWSTNSTVVLVFAFTAFYVALSGMKGVIVTDVIQGTLLFLTIVGVVVAGLYIMGGLGVLARKVDPLYFNPVNERFSAFQCFTLFCTPLFASIINPLINNRFLAVKTCGDARKTALTDVSMGLIFSIFVVLAGIIAAANFPGLRGMKVQEAFIHYVFDLFPTGLLGLFFVGVFSATMSSVDSEIHTATAYFTTDFYKNVIKPDMSDSGLLKLSRYVVVALLFLALMVSFIIDKVGGIFSMMVNWAMPFGSPMAIILAASLVFRSLSRRVAWVAVLASMAFFVFQKITGFWGPYSGLVVPLFCIAIILVGMVVAKPYGEEKASIDALFDELHQRIKAEKQTEPAVTA